ncbi:YicC/YloC family endoribonuclease [Brevibacillus fulvus]|uniref:Uncharacterized protein (TIGR00255 family) n=1 Tax=Brevibacillus fulvus TaxID=1125967 RepID=A0A938Y0M2_9BACL|nr:YicC/YloC family endoribonuclease [Brevibacillus fulvus]MBM7589392.1 uncharacterized protein (TIGR00255 family) [Brevibacillus fulvus]
MIRSMSGYGRKVAFQASFQLTVEMRSVNHRFCEVVVRLPKSWGMLEGHVKKIVSQYIQRGRVEVNVAIEHSGDAHSAEAAIDWNQAELYVQGAKQLVERFSLQDQLTAKDLLLMPGVLQQKEDATAPAEMLAELLEETVEAAVIDLLQMRQAEGQKLMRDLQQRLTQIGEWLKQIGELAEAAVEEYRHRLHQRLTDALQGFSFELDQQRLLQEIVLFAERSDISEETTRLESHCAQFGEQLTKTEAVGRKLDFLLQEMNREANTIGSKANYLPIQQLAVEIKTEIEKMREQVQNIE